MRTLIHRSSALRASTDAYGTGILADAGMLSEPSIFGRTSDSSNSPLNDLVVNLQLSKTDPRGDAFERYRSHSSNCE